MENEMAFEQFTTDNYLDTHGRMWFCVRKDKEGRMVCEGENGHFTVASFATFNAWGWKKSTLPTALAWS
jgi:hypothetical protein